MQRNLLTHKVIVARIILVDIQPKDVRWRLAAFLSSMVPIFGAMLPLAYFLGDDSRLAIPITVISCLGNSQRPSGRT